MADLNDARKAVQDRFLTEWSTETLIDFDNEDFTIPEGDTQFVRLVVRNQVGNQDTLGSVGNRKFLRTAVVIIQVFVTIDDGTSEADRLSVKARDIFEGTRFSGLWFFASDINEIGPSEKHFLYNVRCEFNYEQIK